jgi:hypothetical protein
MIFISTIQIKDTHTAALNVQNQKYSADYYNIE